MTMHRDDDCWTLDFDLDRVRATPGGIAGGWIVAGIIAALMVIVPASACVADVAVAHARHKVEKIERTLAQVLPRAMPRHNPVD
jgi:ABC-type thiamin/hydroxymethylpyrimidine transport system permease subunit